MKFKKQLIETLTLNKKLLKSGLQINSFGNASIRYNKAFDYVEFFNDLNFRNQFRICVDGGVDKNIIKILNVDDVVSNSAILSSNNPAEEIVKFQSTKYNG